MSKAITPTPAEEIPPSVKRVMYEKGAFEGIDFINRSHGGPETKEADAGLGGCCSVPINVVKYTFHGKATTANLRAGDIHVRYLFVTFFRFWD